MSDKNETCAARAADELADVADLAAMQALALHGMRSLAAAGKPVDDADALRALARIAEHMEERLRVCVDGLDAGLGEAGGDRAADGDDEGNEATTDDVTGA